MSQAFLNGQFRSEIGKGPVNRLRNDGWVPGIIYGHNIDNVPVEVGSKEINRILRYYGENSLVGIDMGYGVKRVLIKEVQRDPVTRQVLHVDFQEVRHDQMIKTVVPIILIGKEVIEKNGLVLQHQLRELEVECLPQNLPKLVQADVSYMNIGESMTVADIEISEEISILNDDKEIIASLIQIRAAEDLDENGGEEEGHDEALKDANKDRTKDSAKEKVGTQKYNKEVLKS
ncbi:MAG: LSU ribosomal protein L25p [Firmicutes bacterium]|nr:LSU ribosomal protein L25p [Bacillota bacterium]MDI6707419.1 50S ribosomal protein L25 [Bacillota bacterium]